MSKKAKEIIRDIIIIGIGGLLLWGVYPVLEPIGKTIVIVDGYAFVSGFVGSIIFACGINSLITDLHNLYKERFINA